MKPFHLFGAVFYFCSMANNDDQFKKVEDLFTFDFTNFSKRKKKKK